MAKVTVGIYPCPAPKCNAHGHCFHMYVQKDHPRCNECGGEVAILDHSKGHKEDCKTKAALF